MAVREAASELIAEHGENVHYLAAKQIYEAGKGFRVQGLVGLGLEEFEVCGV